MRKKSPRPLQLPILAEVISRSDGTFLLKPKISPSDVETWLTVRQAAELLGGINPRSIYHLLGEYLVYRRPWRTRVSISLKSVLEFRQATNDAEFWTSKASQKRLRQRVQLEMSRLAEEALEILEN